MTSKKKTNKASTEKKVQKPTLKRTPTSEIIAELSSRGIRAEIDYKSTLERLFGKVYNLWHEINNGMDAWEDDEQRFVQVAECLDTCLDDLDFKLDTMSADDCKQALQGADNRLREVQALVELNAMECENEDNAEDMNDIAGRIGDILFYISRYESIAKYLAIEEIAGKVCR